MRKLIDFKELEQQIQTYADKNCEGNFSMAVRMLIKAALDSNKKESK